MTPLNTDEKITPEMVDAGVVVLDRLQGVCSEHFVVQEVYKAMHGQSVMSDLGHKAAADDGR